MSKTAFTLKMKTRQEIEKSIRKTWSFTPASKAFKSKKDYSRFQAKRELDRAVRQGLD